MPTDKFIKMIISAVLSAAMAGSGGCAQGMASESAVYGSMSVSKSSLGTGHRECMIELGDTVSVCGNGVWFSDNTISISEGGTYIFTGEAADGCISVETDDPVKLIFNGVSLSNIDGCAVISKSDELIIEGKLQSDLIGSGGDHGTAVYSEGSTLFVGTGRIDIDGGVFSVGKIEFKDVTSNLSASDIDGGEVIAGTLIINHE